MVHTCFDRLALDGKHTVSPVMAGVPPAGIHKIEVTAEDDTTSIAELELRFARVRVLPPIGKQKRYLALDLTIIHACETTEPVGRARLEWKLATDLAVASTDDAIEALRWYACRWKIELFQKVLKFGCRTESARLQTAECLSKFIAVLCIVAWRVFWTTMTARKGPEALSELALTKAGMGLLDRAVPNKDFPAELGTAAPGRTLSAYLAKVASVAILPAPATRLRATWSCSADGPGSPA